MGERNPHMEQRQEENGVCEWIVVKTCHTEVCPSEISKTLTFCNIYGKEANRKLRGTNSSITHHRSHQQHHHQEYYFEYKDELWMVSYLYICMFVNLYFLRFFFHFFVVKNGMVVYLYCYKMFFICKCPCMYVNDSYCTHECIFISVNNLRPFQ